MCSKSHINAYTIFGITRFEKSRSVNGIGVRVYEVILWGFEATPQIYNVKLSNRFDYLCYIRSKTIRGSH